MLNIGINTRFAIKPIRSLHAFLHAVLIAVFPGVAAAQPLPALQTPDSPLVLQARGSFFIGGEQVEQTAVEIGSFGPDDSISVNQMYVEYMHPAAPHKWPVVMVHGATLSGKTWDTTPDGRMGWYEYFVRAGHPVYVVDQIGRARSGFDQSLFNAVQAGQVAPEQQRRMLRLGDRFGAWTNFRIGPEPGQAFADTQFPVEAAAEFSKQGVPDLTGASRSQNPNWKALSDLALQLQGAVLLVHSQSGPYPLQSALINASGIHAIVMVEPGTCQATAHRDEDIAILANIPTLILFGDHLDAQTQLPAPNWDARFDDCKAYKARIDAAGGNVHLMTTVDAGFHGNTHMMMMDQNNAQIADLILRWIDWRFQGLMIINPAALKTGWVRRACVHGSD